MIKDNLVKEVHKDNSLTDWNNSLQAVWADDDQRPPIYSKELFRRFWDIHVPEARSK
jgi:hypothetical protein